MDRQDVVLAIKLARLAGLRIHECARLTVGHLEDALKEGEVTIKGKGGRVRRVPVSPELRVELEQILAGSRDARGARSSSSRGRKPTRRSGASKSSSATTGRNLPKGRSHRTGSATHMPEKSSNGASTAPRQAADQRGQDACGGAVGARQAGGDEHLPAWWQVITWSCAIGLCSLFLPSS